MDKAEAHEESSQAESVRGAVEGATAEPEEVRGEEHEENGAATPQNPTKKKVRRGKGGRGGRARRRQRARAEREEAETSYRLFVMNVQPHVSAESLHAHFDRFGHVMDVYMPVNVSTQQRKGVAFVSFTTSEGLYNALRSGMHLRLQGSRHVVAWQSPTKLP